MPRPPRTCPNGVPQHIVNRGNLRARIFRQRADYLGFLCALVDAAEKTVVRLLAFCLMPNHFHLVLWPVKGEEVSAYMQMVMNSHIRDLQRRHGTTGTGHVYQGRYKNSMITSEAHFLNVCRYVEGNARTAGLVDRAESWEWCSLARSGPAPGVYLLSEWPVAKPKRWVELVNRPLGEKELRELKRQERRGRRADACETAQGWLAPLQ